ncbi:hypothetical protein F5Y16DRAFT_375192 [Xylariaceae sp. FL0255]|nr:hypothetical protein F5Y16DRAFT_375192 [Xylariaceae sp. FL0255]
MSSHSKPTRSRFSSPHHRAGSPLSQSQSRGGASGGVLGAGAMATTAASGTDASRSFMQRWLEPPVQSKASYQEAGLIRGGVVENMAPLGTLPKAAAMRKNAACAAAESPLPTSGVKRIVLKKPFSTTPSSVAATPNAAAETPTISRTSSTESAILADTGDILLPLSIPIVDDVDDEDYVPKKRPKTRRLSPGAPPSILPLRRQSHRHRSAQSSPAPMAAPSSVVAPAAPVPAPTPAITPTPKTTTMTIAPAVAPASSPTPTPTATPAPAPILPPSQQTPEQSPSPPSPPSPTQSDSAAVRLLGREPDDKEHVDKVVEAAVDEAIRHYRYPTAWALRLLYDENSSDPRFVSMIEDIFYQRASSQTVGKFLRMVSEKKRDGKKENKGCYYFVPPTTGRPHKPEPAPYEDLLRMEFSTILRASVSDFNTDRHVNKKRRTDSTDQQLATADQQVDSADTVLHVAARTDMTTEEAKGGAAPSPGHGDKGSHQRHHKTKSPIKRKKTRTGSVSSTSSLSSVPDDAIEDFDDFMGEADSNPDVSRPDVGNLSNAQIPAGLGRPIKGKHAKSAAKKNDPSPNPAPAQNTPAAVPASTPSARPSMPTTTTTTVTLNGNTTTPQAASSSNQSLNFPSRFGQPDESVGDLGRKLLDQKAKTVAATIDNSEESFVREPLPLDELPEDLTLVSLPPRPAPVLEQARLSRTPVPPLSSRAARAAKRNNDDFDEAISPTASSFRADLEPSSARNSRAATPANARSTKKPRGGLRVKTSPMKKKGTAAGIPRATGERPSPIGSGGANNNQDDNDDSCYTCGGNGELVCCDGCAYSFHFNCIDPPMDEGHVPDEWYCNECQHRFFPSLISKPEGIFGPLLTNLDRKNPRAFRLPESIRDYFDAVKTGAEGEYEEVAPAKPKTTKKNAEEPFDFFKLRNGDKAVLCHHCHKGAVDNQPIIPCSVCGLNWHLECLDPPLTIPPVLRTWRCPCHVDDLLSSIPARLAPAHKYRKVKNAPVIEQGYSRGMINNGYVEILEDDSDEESDSEAWREEKSFGRVFRISAKGIKKDFLDKVRRNRAQPNLDTSAVSNPAPSVPRSLEENQAALNLLSVSQMAGAPSSGADQLIQALLSEASPSVISLMAQGDASRLAAGQLVNADIRTLEAMLAQADAMRQSITQLLDGRTKRSKTNADAILSESKALTPNSISHDDSTVVDELRLDMGSSQNTGKTSEIDRRHSVDDHSMQLD